MPLPPHHVQFWVGTYPHAGAGTAPGMGEGIWRLSLDQRSGQIDDIELIVTTPSPSYLLAHPLAPVVYAVGETAPGTITAFEVQNGGLRRLCTLPAGGDGPCHLELGPGALGLHVATYGSGTVATVPLTAEGRFGRKHVQSHGHSGYGPREDRQASPHAHFVSATPSGEHLLVSDLGTDELRRYSLTTDGRLLPEGIAASLPAGSGPRHLSWAPDGGHLYVVGELDGRAYILRWDERSARAHVRGSTPLHDSPTHGGSGAPPHLAPSHIVTTPEHTLVALRATNEVILLSSDAATVSRRITLPGAWPRHFALHGRWLLVALEHSHLVASIDIATGELTSSAELPSPACVSPARIPAT